MADNIIKIISSSTVASFSRLCNNRFFVAKRRKKLTLTNDSLSAGGGSGRVIGVSNVGFRVVGTLHTPGPRNVSPDNEPEKKNEIINVVVVS